MMSKNILLEVKNLEVVYKLSNATLKAVDGISFEVFKGEKLGIAGESGCGKSTLAYSLLGLVPPPGYITKGEILYYGWGNPVNVLSLSKRKMQHYRWEETSIVFQAAQSTLNPVIKIKEHFIDTVSAHNKKLNRTQVYEYTKKLLKHVRLDESVLDMYPHQLSGGMKQRVIIALSLILNPKVLILDEPTSALDLLTQEYIIEVINELSKNLNLTVIFITHDLSILAKVTTRIVIMYAGKIVEIAPTEEIFYHPRHPYTLGLMRAIPSLAGDINSVKSIPGEVPNLKNPPQGCRFHPRCPYATEICKSTEPPLRDLGDRHYVACHMWKEL